MKLVMNLHYEERHDEHMDYEWENWGQWPKLTYEESGYYGSDWEGEADGAEDVHEEEDVEDEEAQRAPRTADRARGLL